MKPKLIVVFLLLVLLPLGLLAWLGARLAHYEREDTRRRFEQLLLARLGDSERAIAKRLEQLKRELLRLTKPATPAEEALRVSAGSARPIDVSPASGAADRRRTRIYRSDAAGLAGSGFGPPGAEPDGDRRKPRRQPPAERHAWQITPLLSRRQRGRAPVPKRRRL